MFDDLYLPPGSCIKLNGRFRRGRLPDGTVVEAGDGRAVWWTEIPRMNQRMTDLDETVLSELEPDYCLFAESGEPLYGRLPDGTPLRYGDPRLAWFASDSEHEVM